MLATPSDAMLDRVMAEAQRALDALDPASRADIIARFVQPYSGWALRWAIDDCRAHGMAWTTIAGILDRPYSTVLRQTPPAPAGCCRGVRARPCPLRPRRPRPIGRG